jgi:hypothetical protein
MNELHPAVHSALETLAPSFENVPADWDDALRRGATESGTRTRAIIAIAIAVSALVVLAASPFGQAVVSDTLTELGAWLDDEPGEPASSEEQRAFEADNAASYASFPTGTRVGVLLRSDFQGEEYTLFGFRDREALCLRLTPNSTGGDRFTPAECVPQTELARLEAPIAVLVGNGVVSSTDGRCATAVYGLATNRVERVTIERPLTGSTTVAVGNNAFVSISEARDCRSNAATSATAVFPSGQRSTTRIPGFPAKFFGRPEPEELPGPAEVERRLTDGAVGWLERGEQPGQAYDWPSQSDHTMLTSRVLHPDPAISFRLGVGFARGDADGDWYCLAHLWPLVKGPVSHMCGRADWVRGGIGLSGAWPNDTQFPLYVGLAADDVATLELYYESGGRRSIRLVDNAFAFQVPAFEHVKLVARDHEGRVVKILVL